MTWHSDIAWAAGIVEGEGCIGADARGHHGAFTPRMTVAMTDEDVIRRLADIFGIGKVYGPHQRGTERKPMWTWGIHNFEHWQAAWAMVWPWLGERRKEQVRTSAATMKEAFARSPWKKNRCKRGHDLTDETMIYRRPDNPSHRQCSPCRRYSMAAWRAHQQGESLSWEDWTAFDEQR